MADTLQAAHGIDVHVVMPMLTEVVPLPTEEEELIARHWPKNAPWRDKRRIDHAAAHRDRVLQEVRELLVDAIRPGEKEWRKAVTAWDMAETAYSFGFWDEYARREQYGLDFASTAIAKSCTRSAPANAYADSWRTIFDEHVRRLSERRPQTKTHRGAQESCGRSSSQSSSSDSQSLVERARHGSLRECAVIIGASWPCAPDELKRTYRDAAMRHHPDRGGDPERMLAINIAKERLDSELVLSEAKAV